MHRCAADFANKSALLRSKRSRVPPGPPPLPPDKEPSAGFTHHYWRLLTYLFTGRQLVPFAGAKITVVLQSYSEL